MEWLKKELKASEAHFRIILSSVPITDYRNLLGSTEAQDRWQGYEQRAELMTFLEEEDIPGVLFIAGDFHFGQVCHVSPQGAPGSSLYEVLVGPGGSFINPMGGLIQATEQFIIGLSEWSYTEFVCDSDQGTLAITFLSDDGDILAEYTIAVS